jgi:hypothetical protein
VVEEVMPVLLTAIETDDDKAAVSVAITAAAEIVRGCGAAACAQFMQRLVEAVTKVAVGQALCQVAHSEDDEPLEDEEEPEVPCHPGCCGPPCVGFLFLSVQDILTRSWSGGRRC